MSAAYIEGSWPRIEFTDAELAAVTAAVGAS